MSDAMGTIQSYQEPIDFNGTPIYASATASGGWGVGMVSGVSDTFRQMSGREAERLWSRGVLTTTQYLNFMGSTLGSTPPTPPTPTKPKQTVPLSELVDSLESGDEERVTRFL